MGWGSCRHVLKGDAKSARLQGRRLGVPEVALLGVGGAGAAAGLFSGRWPGLLGMLCLLGWGAAEAGKAAWQAFKAQPDMGGRVLGDASSPAVQRLARAFRCSPVMGHRLLCCEYS